MARKKKSDEPKSELEKVEAVKAPAKPKQGIEAHPKFDKFKKGEN